MCISLNMVLSKSIEVTKRDGKSESTAEKRRAIQKNYIFSVANQGSYKSVEWRRGPKDEWLAKWDEDKRQAHKYCKDFLYLMSESESLWNGHLGHTSIAKHHRQLLLNESRHVHFAPYRSRWSKKDVEQIEINTMFKMGVIESAEMEYSAAIVISPKIDRSTQLCINRMNIKPSSVHNFQPPTQNAKKNALTRRRTDILHTSRYSWSPQGRERRRILRRDNIYSELWGVYVGKKAIWIAKCTQVVSTNHRCSKTIDQVAVSFENHENFIIFSRKAGNFMPYVRACSHSYKKTSVCSILGDASSSPRTLTILGM